jgi:hypothetical protein
VFFFNFEELGVVKLTGKNVLKIGMGKLITKRLIKEHREIGKLTF